MKKVFVTALELLLCAFAALGALQAKGGYIVELSDAAFELINEYREEQGLEPLEYSEKLYKAAQLRCKEIVQSMSHTRPDGSEYSTVGNKSGDRKRRLLYAENIGGGQPSAEGIFESWANSDGHRANMENETYLKSAVACYKVSGSRYTYYWVNVYGK